MDRFFAATAGGASIAKALKAAERSTRTYYDNWINDPWFMAQYELAKAKAKSITGEKLGFVEFRLKVLGRFTYPHMEQWANWFESDESDHIMILCPPETAKTTFVLDYILWRIYLDPQIRIGYVSKSLPHSQKQVAKLKNIIEQNKTLQMLCDNNLVPGPGDPHPWTSSHFTVRARGWASGEDEADYTVNSFGSGSQITGSRFDLIIFDDPDDVNVGRTDRENIWNVILQAGESRLGVSGKMIVIGNRQGEEDVYRLILDQHAEDPELWAIYTQAAVQEWKDERPVKVIWPEKFGLPKTGGWERKPVQQDGPWTEDRALLYFDFKRRRLGHRFFLIYQNDPLADREKDFTREMVDRAINEKVPAGVVPPGAIVVASMDPAPVGGAAVVVYALLPPSPDGKRRRVVVECEWGVNWRTDGTWERIRHYSEKYRPKWWVLEKSATTRYLLDDVQMWNQYRRKYGFYLHEVGTGANKNYGDFAVSSLRDLFFGEETTIIFPGKTAADKGMTKALRDQLVDYHPETSQPHDLPMALWFAERAIKDLSLSRHTPNTQQKTLKGWKNPYGGKWTGGSWNFKHPADLKPDQGVQKIDLVQSGSQPTKVL
jgi:hypothetical protein